jgi:SOS-response transcriptional repressor LexA
MGSTHITLRAMERSADQKRDILRAYMNEFGLKPLTWAKQSGVNANSIYNFLNGHSQRLDPLTYAKLARTAQVPVWRLTGDTPEAPSPTSVWVAGHVEAGAFREAVEWDQSLWYHVDVPVPTRFRGKARGLEVRGPSMNLLYPPGTVVIWVPVLDFRVPRHEDRVIVYSYSDDDGVEATVKELREREDGRWLWPRSDHPDYQTPIDPTAPGRGVRNVEIAGIVIGSYRPEAT